MTLSRRQLISASAGFSLASLVDRWSFAQAQKRQRRLIVLNTEHGLQYQHHPELIGSTAGASYKYPAFLAPVLAETNQVRIVTGLFNTEMNDQHGSFEASLCCVTPPPCGSDSCVHSLGGISIDQVIANALDAASPTIAEEAGLDARVEPDGSFSAGHPTCALPHGSTSPNRMDESPTACLSSQPAGKTRKVARLEATLQTCTVGRNGTSKRDAAGAHDRKLRSGRVG